MPKNRHASVGTGFLDHSGSQREMVVLHENRGVFLALRFFEQSVREAAVHCAVVFPVLLAKDRTRMRDVAQWPQPLVGESEVKALLFLFTHPNAAQSVIGVVRRHLNAVAIVHYLFVGCAGSLRDPGSVTGPQYRFERGHQTTGGNLTFDAVGLPPMFVGLAIGKSKQAAASQFAFYGHAQALRGP